MGDQRESRMYQAEAEEEKRKKKWGHAHRKAFCSQSGNVNFPLKINLILRISIMNELLFSLLVTLSFLATAYLNSQTAPPVQTAKSATITFIMKHFIIQSNACYVCCTWTSDLFPFPKPALFLAQTRTCLHCRHCHVFQYIIKMAKLYLAK